MALEDIVSVTITAETARVSRAGFGVPLVAAYHTNWPERVRTYATSSVLSVMVDEGFAVTDPAYLAVAVMVSQSPRPKQVMIGRRDNDFTQVIRITPTVVTDDTVYAVSVDGTTVSYTSGTSATLASICTGLAAAINAATGITATGVSGTYIDATADDATTLHTYAYVTGYAKNVSILDNTADAGIAADLNAIRSASTAWYGLVIDSGSAAEIAAAAAWAETQVVMFVPTVSDSDVLGSSTTDLFSDLQDFGYARTVPIYHPSQNSFAGAGWLAEMLTYQPGQATWAFKSIAGVAVTTLSETEIANLKSKSANFYVVVGGVSITQDGVSSAGEFADVTVFIDWLRARITERVFALMVNLPKLAYTDVSVDLVRSEIYAQLGQGITIGGLAADPPPVVTAPLVSEVAPQDRVARLLPDVQFTARLAGAIHAVEIRGNLTV